MEKLEFALLEIHYQLYGIVEVVLVKKYVQQKLRATKEIEALHEVSEMGWRIQFVERSTLMGQPDLFFLQRKATEWIEE